MVVRRDGYGVRMESAVFVDCAREAGVALAVAGGVVTVSHDSARPVGGVVVGEGG